MPKYRILIVDDEPDVRAIVKATLMAHYEVVEAEDGLEALEVLEVAEPDFVVLDVMMPLMNGFQTCDAIRKHKTYKDVNVLFLSALNSKEDMMKGYGAGGNLYLTKPFEPARLLRNVDLFFEQNAPPVRPKTYTLEQLNARKKMSQDEVALQVVPGTSRAAASPAPAAPDRARVIFVDDDSALLETFFAALSDEFEVITACDGLEAAEKITSFQPDLIVMDTVMPKMSGYQLCQSLRRNARYSRTPFLFASGKSTPRDREYALKIGGSAFLAKPFAMDDLRQALRALMNIPGFRIYPKSLEYTFIEDMEHKKKAALEEKQTRTKEDTELQRFLRAHEKDEV